MLSKTEIDMLLGLLGSIVTLVESIDPSSAENKIVVEINSVIKTLQSLGL